LWRILGNVKRASHPGGSSKSRKGSAGISGRGGHDPLRAPGPRQPDRQPGKPVLVRPAGVQPLQLEPQIGDAGLPADGAAADQGREALPQFDRPIAADQWQEPGVAGIKAVGAERGNVGQDCLRWRCSSG